MSGIIGSKFNHRGSGLVGSLGTDGQHMLSSGAGKKNVFETVAAATTDLTPVRQDILTLALKQAVEENHTKYNLPNSAIVKFEEDADFNLGGSTDIDRSSDEYIASAILGSYSFTTYTSSSGSFTVPSNVYSVEVLVVAGGGGGAGSDNASEGGGGGGGGGVVHHSALTTTPAGTIAYAVGAAGAAGAGSVGSRTGASGGDSTFGSITADGGGGGGSTDDGQGARDGGSGGGAGKGNATNGDATQGDSGGGTGYGNDGGVGAGGATAAESAGGGGAAAVGGNTQGTGLGGDGGAGRLFSNFTSYGASGYFAGGGGGGGTTTIGDGGSGGGGDSGVAGTANTGGGGGGVSGSGSGAAGGSGFIGLRYAPLLTVNATGTALGSTNVPTSAVTDVSGVILLKDFAGSTTLGTDVKAYFTADNSNWTEATSYADAGTFSTGIKMIKLGKTTCTSGSDVRWKIAFANQSGSKIAQIHGIGINY